MRSLLIELGPWSAPVREADFFGRTYRLGWLHVYVSAERLSDRLITIRDALRRAQRRLEGGR